MRFIYSKTFLAIAGVLVFTVLVLIVQNLGYLDFIRKTLLSAPKPLVQAGKSVGQPVSGFFKTIFSLKAIVTENSELRDQLYKMQEQVVLLDDYKRENESLKQELDFKNKSPNLLVPCTVLATDPEGLTDAIVLNCGQQNGVKVGQGVISQNHLVAKIVYVGSETSTAVLMTSPQAPFDARISKTGEIGLVKGSFNSGIIIDQLSQNAPLEKGDIIITAGINSLIPRNILIGQVGEILSTQNDLFKKAAIISPVAFYDLKYVFVVQ